MVVAAFSSKVVVVSGRLVGLTVSVIVVGIVVVVSGILFSTHPETTRINKIPSIIKSSKQGFSLIIIDTITMLYRASRESNNIKDLNRELSNQLNILSNTAHDFNIPVLITNQVYSDFENKDLVKLVGGDVIKYSSKCLIELEVLKSNLRRAILIKHRSLPMRDVVFEIKEKGVFEFKQRRGFGIF